MFSAGREFHDAIHGHLNGLAPEQPLSDAAAGFWRSVRPVLQHVNAPESRATELPLRHDRLGYQGIVDCVAPFRWVGEGRAGGGGWMAMNDGL